VVKRVPCMPTKTWVAVPEGWLDDEQTPATPSSGYVSAANDEPVLRWPSTRRADGKDTIRPARIVSRRKLHIFGSGSRRASHITRLGAAHRHGLETGIRLHRAHCSDDWLLCVDQSVRSQRSAAAESLLPTSK